MRFPLAAVVVLLGLSGTIVSAQTEGTLAVGGNFRIMRSGDSDMGGESRPGFLWRLGHAESGWGLNYGLNWFNSDLQAPLGGTNVPFGRLRVRPFMAGYGYKRVFGTYSVTFDAIGGFSLNRFDIDPRALDALYRLGARTIEASASNSLAFKPEITVWKDLGPKVGVQINAGYLISRPKVRVASTLGVDERTYRADMVVLSMGVVYSIF